MSICHEDPQMPLLLNCPKSGQFILRKTSRIVATIRQLLVQMNEILFRLGLLQRPRCVG